MRDTKTPERATRGAVDLNAPEPAELAWVVDLIVRFVQAHRGGRSAGYDTSGLGRLYRPRNRDEAARSPNAQRLPDRDLMAVSRAWGQLPRTPWPFGEILRCSYLPGYPRPDVACRLMHIAPASWLRERNAALGRLAEILRRDAAWLAPARGGRGSSSVWRLGAASAPLLGRPDKHE